MINWQALRELHLEEYKGTYLNSPANGLPSIANEAFVTNEISKFREAPGDYRMGFVTNAVPAIKTQIASLVNATSEEIALIQNFSIGLNFFVQSLPKTSKILLLKDDYPSLTKPFEVNNFDIVWTTFEDDGTLDLAKIESHLKNDRPSFFALSHCQYLSGYLADLEGIGALCGEHNCKLIVDATQSFGAISIDVQKCNISVLGASCYKWALAGFGNGFIYINEKTLDTYPPKTAGFNSYISKDQHSEYTPSMRSYEPGHHDHVAFHKLGFALQTIKELNQDIIHTRIVELMDYLVDQLDDADIELAYNFLDENRLGILVVPSKPGLFENLQQHHIEVSERGGNVRVGLHYYNNEEDIDAFVEAISQLK